MRPSDEWIDETARALTEGEPSSGFKARVLARIDDVGSSRRFAWGRFAIASGALAAIILAVVVSREGSEVRLKPDTTTTTASEVRPKPDATNVKSTVEVRLKPDATREARLPLSRLQRFGLPKTPDIRSEMESEMPVMDNAPPPIAVADIEMRSLEIAAVEELDPVVSNDLTIDSIELAPLTTQFD